MAKNKPIAINDVGSIFQLFSNDLDIVILIDDGMRIINFNHCAERFLRASKDNILRENLTAYCQKMGLPCPRLIQDKLPEKESFENYKASKPSGDTDFQHIAWRIVPVLIEKDKYGAFIFGTDNTKLIQEEFLLKNVQAQLELFINSIPGYHWWKDLNGKYLGCNQAVAKLLGLKSPKEVIGKTDYELAWSENADALVANDQKVIKNNQVISSEETVTTMDNVPLDFFVVKMPLKDAQSHIIGTIGTSIDITERKILEKELKKANEKSEAANHAKSKFIANMSHDIRTPLTGIVGLSDILLDTVIKQESKNYAKMLSLSGEQLLSLLNSVLEVVSNESVNQDEIHNTEFSITELLQNLFELQLPALKLKNLTLDLVMDEHIPQFIKTDKGKLYRILLNLLSNSIKFTDEGGISISVHHTDLSKNQFSLCVEILDTGIGIPKTEADKIFNSFYRVHPSHEGKYQGFGLGLHLVKRYVDALGGEISVKSIEGMGTKFFLTIPVEIVDESMDEGGFKRKKALDKTLDEINESCEPEKAIDCETPQTEVISQKDVSENQNTAHVLLVEDNPMAMKVADMMLSKLGVATDKAYNSQDALALFKKNHYDFVLTDIGLPDYSGFELAQKMKAFENERGLPSPTPIIGLTAHAKQEALLQGSQCGMIEVGEKPLTAKTANAYVLMFGRQQNKEGIADRNAYDAQTNSSDMPLLDVDLGVSQLGSVTELKEMLDIMLKQSLVITIDEIDNQFQQQNWEQFEKLVHKFKSSCLYCATTQLLTLTQTLEQLANSQAIHQIEPIYRQFQDCVIATRQYIESWLSMNQS